MKPMVMVTGSINCGKKRFTKMRASWSILRQWEHRGQVEHLEHTDHYSSYTSCISPLKSESCFPCIYPWQDIQAYFHEPKARENGYIEKCLA